MEVYPPYIVPFLSLRWSPKGKPINWLLKTGGPLIQVHLDCTLAQVVWKRWLQIASDPLIEVTIQAGLTAPF